MSIPRMDKQDFNLEGLMGLTRSLRHAELVWGPMNLLSNQNCAMLLHYIVSLEQFLLQRK